MEGTIILENHFAFLNDINDTDNNAKPIIWQLDREINKQEISLYGSVGSSVKVG